MRSFLADLRHGVRLLWRSPLFTVIASASLALGIGANTAIFTVVNTLLLKPLPVREPAQLVSIFTSDYSGPPFGASSYPDALDFADAAPALSGLAASTMEALSLTERGVTERVYAEIVNPSYFDVLGIRPRMGHAFSAPARRAPGAAQPGGDSREPDASTVIIGHRFWTRKLGANPGVIGRRLVLNGQPFTIAGVMGADYPGLLRVVAVDVWLSADAHRRLVPTSSLATSRGNRSWMLMGRLAPAATIDQLRAQLTVQASRLQQAYPDNWTDVNRRIRRVTVLRESESRLPPQASSFASAFLGALLAIVGIVLLVACANVAGLLLARGTARRREIAVRLALGAGRLRLVRQLVTESAALAILSGVLGLLVAQWTLALIARLEPPVPVTLALDMSLDGRVLAFTAIVALVGGVLFGLAPAIHATRVALLPVLRNDVVWSALSRRFSLRNMLVVSQVAMSLLLLVVSGLFLRSVQSAWRIDTGFDTRNVLTATIDPSMLGYSPERSQQVYETLLERVRGLSIVQAAAVARVVPLSFGTGRRGMRPEGYQARVGEDLEEPFNMVSPGYFETMGIRLVRGRDFTGADRAGAEPVIIVNEAFARRYWPGQDPLQKRVSVRGDEGPWMRVVGLAANAKYFTLSEEPRATMFLPFLQDPAAEATLHVKARGSIDGLSAAIRDTIRAVDPAVPILGIVSLEEQTSLSLLPQQLAIRLLGAFGSLALLMAAMGLYGVLAQTVAQRTREIGIRVALGASRSAVVGLVVRQGIALTATGIVLGLVAAFGASRLIGSFLFVIGPLDPLAWLTGMLVLAGAAVVAVWVPARRATRVDPAVALRYE
jgi:macrolide transport system ATP-binding/permease protein